MRLEVRDEVVQFAYKWSQRAKLPLRQICASLGISPSKLSIWRGRAGTPNQHAPHVRRAGEVTPEEKAAVVAFYLDHVFDGYRRCAYMMLDANIAALHPSTVFLILKEAGVLRSRTARRGCKGLGFKQPNAVHRHWHTDITHVVVDGRAANLCCIIDGFSRYILAWTLSWDGDAICVETTLQKALERFPGVHPRMISDNGKQFVCRDYKQLLAMAGLTRCTTSPYYPQSNGKIERFHDTLKNEILAGKVLNGIDYAQECVGRAIDHYNNVRLHSAIGYVTPRDALEGRSQEIFVERARKLQLARELRRRAG